MVESWPGGSDMLFFGNSGKLTSNRREEQELSITCLRILQSALVYVNTLMIQNVLADETWLDRMAEEDFRALTPLIHNHVNPYGSFKLDMAKRLPLDELAALVA